MLSLNGLVWIRELLLQLHRVLPFLYSHFSQEYRLSLDDLSSYSNSYCQSPGSFSLPFTRIFNPSYILFINVLLEWQWPVSFEFLTCVLSTMVLCYCLLKEWAAIRSKFKLYNLFCIFCSFPLCLASLFSAVGQSCYFKNIAFVKVIQGQILPLPRFSDRGKEKTNKWFLPFALYLVGSLNTLEGN